VLGLKGLADKNGDKKVTLLEIDSYLKENVGNESRQKQIPIVFGDLKSVLSQTNEAILASAIKEKNARPGGGQDLVTRGVGNSKVEYDSSRNKLIKRLVSRINEGVLIEPESDCAVSVYKELVSKFPLDHELSVLRLRLIQALQRSFNVYLARVYLGIESYLGIIEKYEMEKCLLACLDLAGKNMILKNRLNADLLFLQAVELAMDIRPGSLDYFSTEKLSNGIVLLKRAISLDPLRPYLYMKLGDYYLYTGQFKNAIDSYSRYNLMLPNDEVSYNKLGLAFNAIGNKEQAKKNFEHALRINPFYDDARMNYRILNKIN
jgi:tetratricopeptide (TPR) repeat protein